MKKILIAFALVILPFALMSQKESFNTFIKKFSLDSVFQMERIVFPLTYVTWDYGNDEEQTINLKKSDWKYDKLYYAFEEKYDAYPVFYDNFDCDFRDTGEMIFQWKGFYSVDRRYYFKRIENRWYLIKILDYDPLE
jgi:hypothetical protein